MAYVHSLLLAEFDAAASRAAAARPDVDAETAREVMAEAAELLHDSLALDALTEGDAAVVVRNLASDLTAPDPGEAVRARSAAVAREPTGLDDPGVVAETYLLCAVVLQL